MSEHTKTPWYASDILDNDCYGIVSADEKIIIGTSGNVRRKEDMQFIVRAVNNFDQMLNTLKLCFEEWPERITPCYKELKESIAQAEKKP